MFSDIKMTEVTQRRIWACADAIIQSDCQYFNYKILLGHADFGEHNHTRSPYNKLGARNSHELVVFVLGNLCNMSNKEKVYA